MILVKIKGEGDESTRLRNVKAIKLHFQNKLTRESSSCTEGWQSFLEGAGGDRQVTLRIRGITCNSKAETVLSAAALSNTTILCEITLSSSVKEIISAKFFVERYEKACEAGALEYFWVILVSHGKVEHNTLVI